MLDFFIYSLSFLGVGQHDKDWIRLQPTTVKLTDLHIRLTATLGGSIALRAEIDELKGSACATPVRGLLTFGRLSIAVILF